MEYHMSNNHPPEEDAVPASLAPVLAQLKTPFHARADFERHVMESIHACNMEDTGTHRNRQVPRRGTYYTLVLTPFRIAVAAAATLAVVGGLLVAVAHRAQTTEPIGVRSVGTTAAITPFRHDTTYIVRFVFVTPNHASTDYRVSLVGDFNEWTKDSTYLVPSDVHGVWTATVALPPGRHEYAFVVHTPDGDQWHTDPLTSPVRDDFGTETSVLTVGL
jgi:hypothetical protein